MSFKVFLAQIIDVIISGFPFFLSIRVMLSVFEISNQPELSTL